MVLHSPEGWAALASDFLDMVRARKPGTAEVRIFNASLKQHGWESPHTVIQIVNDDMPFLVDSVTMALAEQGIGVHVLGHPVAPFQRDKAGKLIAVGEGKAESLMHLEIDRQSAAAMPAIEHKDPCRARGRACDGRATGTPCARKMLEVADDLATRRMPVSDAGRREAQEFLNWAADDHFTFLGYREYKVEGKGGTNAVCGRGYRASACCAAGKPANRAR